MLGIRFLASFLFRILDSRAGIGYNLITKIQREVIVCR